MARKIVAKAMALLFSFSLAQAETQNALPFKLFDTHVHFVSDDFVSYPTRSEPPPNEHEKQMREFYKVHPTSARRIFELWEVNGIEGGIGVQYRTAYGTDNRYLLETAALHPQRISAVVILDAADEQSPGRLREMAKDISGVRFTGGRNKTSGDYPWLDSAAALRTWAVADELGLTVVLMTLPALAPNPEAIACIGALAGRFPNVNVVFDHIGWAGSVAADSDGLVPALAALKSHRNIYYKFSTINLELLEKHGMPAADFVRRLVDLYGTDHMMWGSDLGNTPSDYKDLVNQAWAAMAALSLEEKRRVMRETGLAVFVKGGRGKKSP